MNPITIFQGGHGIYDFVSTGCAFPGYHIRLIDDPAVFKETNPFISIDVGEGVGLKLAVCIKNESESSFTDA